MRSYDIVGNIAVLKEEKGNKKRALAILRENPHVKTAVEKVGKFKGRLRKMQTRFLAGEKTKEVLYKENDCVFRFNLDETYFSPRLSNERKEIASKIGEKDKVLVMFAGVAPFSIVIAKRAKPMIVFSNEINRQANKYAELNIELNKVKGKVILVPGDARKLPQKMKELCSLRSLEKNVRAKSLTKSGLSKYLVQQNNLPKFDVIIMPRPQLKDSFLDIAFKLCKKGTKIFYYDFCEVENKEKIIERIKSEAKKAKKKIKILRIKDAGEIAPYKVRIRVDVKVL